jgi:hypothetical protein
VTAVRALAAPLLLVAARARRRPARWLLPAIGLTLATAFACAVAAEGVIAGDRAARVELSGLGTLQRSVRVTWEGPLGGATDRQARQMLTTFGLPAPTRVSLLSPVRLDGILVRPAAIQPLADWVNGAGGGLGRCTARRCPVLLAGGGRLARRSLSAAGVHLEVVGRTTLRSAAPLEYTPAQDGGYPLLLTGDVAGLDRVAGLSGVFRSHSWLAVLDVSRLESWKLTNFEHRLLRAQAALTATNSQFSLSAPFTALDGARSAAAAAPRRLLLAGGGALAALAMFVVLAAYGLRLDQRAEVDRLSLAGARTSQRLVFSFGEAAALAALAMVLGAALGVAATLVLAGGAGLPASGVLDHSLLSGSGLAALLGGWLLATAVIGAVLVAPTGRPADVLALVAAAVLVVALTRGAPSGGALPVLLAPLACLAGGVLVYRAAAGLLRGGERLARHGPLSARLAFVGLARSPVAPALAIAFIAVSTGLAGFALAYRATLLRGTADQAADQVPLDATVTASQSFQTPLQVASIQRWRALAGGPVLPIRRTYATFTDGAASVTVPALGVPASGLPLIHGWRSRDGSLSRPAPRLVPPGPTRNPGPHLPAGGGTLSLTISASAAAVEVTADLRNPAGAITQIPIGLAAARPRTSTVRLPAGPHELEALELDEPAGEQTTTGHQLAENPGAATQFTTGVALGPAVVGNRAGTPIQTDALGRWVAVGAAGGGGGGGARVRLHFQDSGAPGIVRPRQPSDTRPVPVLTDPATADAASATGRIALNIDGLPVTGAVIGVLRRFPTLAPDAPGFVVADEATLASALDASLPGQGRPDELWIDTPHPRALSAAVRKPPLAALGTALRANIQHALRTEPIAVGTLGTLAAAAGLAAALALVGLLAALVGGLREPRVQRDLAVQGLGPRALRGELRWRFLLAGGLGVVAGFVLAAILTRLAVAAVQAGATLQAPRPALVTVAPWTQLALGGVAVLAAFALAGWLAAGILVRPRGAG